MSSEAEDSAQIETLAASMEEVGLFAVIEQLCTGPDAAAAAVLIGKLARHFYPTDLGLSVALWQAGIQHCLSESGRGNAREALRQKAIACSFNLGANTWPGWGEHTVSDTHLALGREAARLNLQLVRELAKGPLEESRSLWLIGAHSIAISDFASARQQFAQAKALAHEGGDAESELMNDGYIALTRVLSDDSGAEAALTTALAALRANAELKHGTFFAAQLDTALRVFGAGRTV